MNLNDLATVIIIKTFQLVIIFASLGHGTATRESLNQIIKKN